jgi:hypothetical protein
MTSIIKVNALETGADTLNVGEAGQNVIIGADSIKNNVVKDAGGNAIFTSDGSGVLSGLNAAFGSASTLVSTTTASNTASVTYTLTDTYNEYIFECITINPVTDNVALQFQVSSDGTNYDKTITSTYYVAYTTETGSPTGFVYDNLWDQGSGTAFQTIFKEVGNDADQACSVIMHLFNPSSTTYIKNFFARGVGSLYHQYVQDQFSAGYFNDTTAMTSIRFKMSSGNINAGKIKMYGIK